MIVSPAGGQGTSQILKISHPSTASHGQLQSLAQTLITAKSADGNIVQLRSAQPSKPVMATSHSGNITLGNVQNVKTAQSAIKRTAQNTSQNRNVRLLMILYLLLLLYFKIFNKIFFIILGVHKNDINWKSSSIRPSSYN